MNPFQVLKKASGSRARAGSLATSRGEIQTPVFMPVGTLATVKGILPKQLMEMNAQIILANAFHLHIRPGDELIRDMGGIHKFMGWKRPILTDSGGYQVFSLNQHLKISEEGVEFNSPVDGARITYTPERVIDIQRHLGVDIMMPLDECLPADAEPSKVPASVDMTLRWLERSKRHWKSADSAQNALLFGIVQGGMLKEERVRSAQATALMDLPGHSIGGLSVGESQDVMMEMVEATVAHLPENKPRYLMGVGYPDDMLLAIDRGVDMFDCVLPTRNGRNGAAFTACGMVVLRNSEHKKSDHPIDNDCECYTCSNFSRAYIRHLIMSGEMLGSILVSLHNIQFYIKFIDNIRTSIMNETFSSFKKDFLSSYKKKEN